MSLRRSTRRQDLLWSRLVATSINHATDLQAISLDPPPQRMLTGAERIATLADVYAIALRHLPIPSNTVPWEEIVSFKKDSDTKRRLVQLRVHLNSLSKMGGDYKELFDNMSQSVFEYEDYVKRSGTKYTFGLIESTITAAPDLDLKFFQKALKFVSTPLIGVLKRKAVLMEEEAKAPGNELSYIVKAVKKFGVQ